MAERRELSLSPREAETRDKKQVQIVAFQLTEVKQHFDENIAAIESQFVIADTLVDENIESAMEIWRSQIVFLESAFDFFIHEITKYGMAKIFNGEWKSTNKYDNFTIKLSEVMEAIKHPEDQSWFLENVNSSLSTLTFMSNDSFKDQMNLIGVEYAYVARTAFYEPGGSEKPETKMKRYLNQLYLRRNIIAHQSDREHSSAARMNIDKSYVQYAITNMKTLVSAITGSVEAKDASE